MKLADKFLLEGLDLSDLDAMADTRTQKAADTTDLLEAANLEALLENIDSPELATRFRAFLDGEDDPDLVPDLEQSIESTTRSMRKHLDKARHHASNMSDAFKTILRMAKVIDAQNVAEWVNSRTTFLYEDLASVAPPWPVVWTEFSQSNGRIGMLGYASEGPFLDELVERDPHGGFRAEGSSSPVGENGYRNAGSLWVSNNLDMEKWEEIRWLWEINLFVEHRRKIVGPVFAWKVALDEWGFPVDMTYRAYRHFDDTEKALSDTQRVLTIFLQTISFTNLRNVVLEERVPAPAINKRHKRKRKTDEDLVTYGMIRIDPLGARKSKTETSSSTSELNATKFHIARGGFRHYGNCCPGQHPPNGLLFGRLEGVFYVPAHVRGNPERGVKFTDVDITPGDPA